MAYDEHLASRIRRGLGERSEFTERTMFWRSGISLSGSNVLRDRRECPDGPSPYERIRRGAAEATREADGLHGEATHRIRLRVTVRNQDGRVAATLADAWGESRKECNRRARQAPRSSEETMRRNSSAHQSERRSVAAAFLTLRNGPEYECDLVADGNTGGAHRILRHAYAEATTLN